MSNVILTTRKRIGIQEIGIATRRRFPTCDGALCEGQYAAQCDEHSKTRAPFHINLQPVEAGSGTLCLEIPKIGEPTIFATVLPTTGAICRTCAINSSNWSG